MEKATTTKENTKKAFQPNKANKKTSQQPQTTKYKNKTNKQTQPSYPRFVEMLLWPFSELGIFDIIYSVWLSEEGPAESWQSKDSHTDTVTYHSPFIAWTMLFLYTFPSGTWQPTIYDWLHSLDHTLPFHW